MPKFPCQFVIYLVGSVHNALHLHKWCMSQQHLLCNFFYTNNWKEKKMKEKMFHIFHCLCNTFSKRNDCCVIRIYICFPKKSCKHSLMIFVWSMTQQRVEETILDRCSQSKKRNYIHSGPSQRQSKRSLSDLQKGFQVMDQEFLCESGNNEV